MKKHNIRDNYYCGGTKYALGTKRSLSVDHETKRKLNLESPTFKKILTNKTVSRHLNV
jgi:hypothetical protein